MIDWSSQDPSHHIPGAFMTNPWVAVQIGAYNDCLKNARGKAQWLAMLDIDEFIVPKQGVASFYKLLKKAQQKKRGAVSLQWRVFGTSHMDDLNPDEYLTEKLVWRAQDTHEWNRLVKTIYQPEHTDFCLVPVPDKLSPGFKSTMLKPTEACIHHYWFRTTQFCEQKRNMTPVTHPDFFAEFHQVEDRSIVPYITNLKNGKKSTEPYTNYHK